MYQDAQEHSVENGEWLLSHDLNVKTNIIADC